MRYPTLEEYVPVAFVFMVILIVIVVAQHWNEQYSPSSTPDNTSALSSTTTTADTYPADKCDVAFREDYPEYNNEDYSVQEALYAEYVPLCVLTVCRMRHVPKVEKAHTYTGGYSEETGDCQTFRFNVK